MTEARIEDLWLKIDHLHRRLLQANITWRAAEETPANMDLRNKLEGLVAEYLSLVPHNRKFVSISTGDLVTNSIKWRQKFSLAKVAKAFRAVEEYAAKLINQPWRQEFWKIHQYSGFYKHSVEPALCGADKLFLEMGFASTSYQVLELPAPRDGRHPVNIAAVTCVARDCVLACVECSILAEIQAGVYLSGLRTGLPVELAEVAEFRRNHIGPVDQAVRELTIYRSKMQVKDAVEKKSPQKFNVVRRLVLDESNEYRMVFCHLEFLRSSTSPALHLTQLAACSSSSSSYATSPIFLPVAPPVLAEYLDNYKLSGDLMQTLTMVRDNQGTFLFRPPVLVEKVQRVECLPESEALQAFLDFLQANGPNITLVGLDEGTLGVLMQKLTELDRATFLKQVAGYTWWARILKCTNFHNYKDLSLDEFFQSTFSPPPGAPFSCSLVAERLKLAVKEVACRKGIGEVSGGKFASTVAVPVQARPRLEKMEVIEGQMEEVNSYLAIPVTSFAVSRMEQVDIDPDDSSEACLLSSELDSSGEPIKHKRHLEEAIYINSDSSDGEEIVEEMMDTIAPEHHVMMNPRLLNTSHSPQPLEATACQVNQLRSVLQFTPAMYLPPPQLAIPLRLTSLPPPNLSTMQGVRPSSLPLPTSNHRAAVSLTSPHVTVSTSSHCVKLTEDAPQKNPTPNSAEQLPLSAWQVVNTGRRKLSVFCPVCNNQAHRTRPWIVQHMKEHEQEWSRPCQMCIDQGDPLRTVAPERLLTHIQHHEGRKCSKPPQPPKRATASQTLQHAPVPTADVPTQSSVVWELVERGGEQWVVCPACPSDKNTKVKPKNIVRHLAKAHMVSYQDRLCPGCKVAVPPEQLVNHTACKHSNQPIATDETPLKRKASTDATSSSLKKFRTLTEFVLKM